MIARFVMQSEDIWNSESHGKHPHAFESITMATPALPTKRIGLAYWMQEVLHAMDKVAENFDADAVHDLRTALRRCRSIADGMMVFDANPAWKKMKKAGKQLFQSLGELRDTHVLKDWIERLAPENDPAAAAMKTFLAGREVELRVTAAAALYQFDCSKWAEWARLLPGRVVRIPLDSAALGHLALERWQQARDLHRRALRNRTNVAFHDLRIGIKRFRYTAENFLPTLHVLLAEDFKEMQDALGDVHDLDVLWQTMVAIHAFPDSTAQESWRFRVREMRNQHLQKYRA